MATPNVVLPGEVWKDVQGYESAYQINALGNVRSKSSGLMRKPHISKNGYPKVTLHNKGILSCKLVHRLIAIHFIPNPDDKPHVNHIDGVKSNNAIENLEWVTRRENAQHASRMGLLDEVAKKAKVRMKAVGAKYGSTNIHKAISATVKRFAVVDSLGQVISEHENVKKFCRDNRFNSTHFFTCINTGKPYRGVQYKYL